MRTAHYLRLVTGRPNKPEHFTFPADIAPIIKDLQAAGAESLRAIATGLNDAGVPTARGHGMWSAVQVTADTV